MHEDGEPRIIPQALWQTIRERPKDMHRTCNFVDFIGEGRGSQALGKTLVETERRVGLLSEEVEALRLSREKIFRPPPVAWIRERRRPSRRWP